MALTIHTPRTLLTKHSDVCAISLILFLIGFILGLQPQYGQPIIEEAQKREIEPTATYVNFRDILTNNGLIASLGFVGWFLFPFWGLMVLPPTIMVYSIGATFGAVVSYVSIPHAIITLCSFGIIELFGFLLTTAGGLLIPKYALYKIVGKTIEFTETVKDAFSFLLYGIICLFLSALFEALLINPATTAVAILIGVLATAFMFLLLRKEA